MSRSAELNLFLESIMHISVLRAGGASAGILGYSGTDGSVVNSLKKSAAAFAAEYSRSGPDVSELQRRADELRGFLQTLQLTNTLSEEAVNGLVDQLQTLLEMRAE